jgi:hypothetical protein
MTRSEVKNASAPAGSDKNNVIRNSVTRAMLGNRRVIVASFRGGGGRFPTGCGLCAFDVSRHVEPHMFHHVSDNTRINIWISQNVSG